MSMQLPTLTVVMPCLNEQENIATVAQETLGAFDRYGIDGGADHR